MRKCPYCDFNSHELRGDIPETAYLDALIEDAEHAAVQVWGRRVRSVFLGGGTPSLLSPAGVDRLLSALRAVFALAPQAEVTLEANPGTVCAQRFAAYRRAGVNRISLGVQSFDAASLAALGRIHGEREAREAIDAALRHFDDVNIDLMYALPGQSLASACRDFERAAACAVPHVSAYQLTIEPNTAFAASPPALPGEDVAAQMQAAAEATFAAAGLVRYEVSAFAREGRRCAHNLNYWHFGDYLGIGAGAHGKLSSRAGIVREVREAHPRRYLERAAGTGFVHASHPIPAAELPLEFMMNALRLVGGVDVSLFSERTGLPLTAIEPALARARARGLLHDAPGRIAASELGLRFLNDLLELFVPPQSA